MVSVAHLIDETISTLHVGPIVKRDWKENSNFVLPLSWGETLFVVLGIGEWNGNYKIEDQLVENQIRQA